MTNYATRILLAALLIGTGMTLGLAHAHQLPSADPHRSATSVTTPIGRESPFGYPTTGSANRAVSVDQKTRYLNVTRLETVTINAGGKSVTWTFDTLDTRSFPLSKIIAGFENVTVYVSESPQYLN